MELLLSKTTAVLIVDLQRGLLATNPPPGDLPAMLDRINDLSQRARAARAVVVLVRHDGTEQEGVVPQSEGWQLDPRLTVDSADLQIRKSTGDSFFQTPLETELRSRGVDCVVICGFATDFCIDATLRGAVSKSFRVVLAADAHTTHDGPELKVHQIRRHFNWVWAESSTAYPVKVIPVAEIAFQTDGDSNLLKTMRQEGE
jgi:nicotinamidase-related amidase